MKLGQGAGRGWRVEGRGWRGRLESGGVIEMEMGVAAGLGLEPACWGTRGKPDAAGVIMAMMSDHASHPSCALVIGLGALVWRAGDAVYRGRDTVQYVCRPAAPCRRSRVRHLP